MIKNITIDDTLDERVAAVEQEVVEAFGEYVTQNPEAKREAANDVLTEIIFNIADGATPVYYTDINDIFYLHGNDVEAAFDDAGLGEKNDKDYPCGWRAAAICMFFEAKAREKLNELLETIKE